MDNRIAVVVSQSRSKNPARRALEDAIVEGVPERHSLDVFVVENLCDLKPDGPGLTALREIQDDMIVLSWLFPRAAHWVLDRSGVSGRCGQTELAGQGKDEEDAEPTEHEDEPQHRVIDDRELPDRTIYCLDLRLHSQAETYVAEVLRIAEGGDAPMSASQGAPSDRRTDAETPNRIDEDTGRRWYPVIDYSRCTNCMECIDFCLFGVYGLDRADNILVEQPDNCRKGCPACSRVCPESAIIFPQHKTPAIAGAPGDTSGSKIDLSALFGAPDDSADALDLAARERDEQMRQASHDADGQSSTERDKLADAVNEPRDELDELIDQLDELDL